MPLFLSWLIEFSFQVTLITWTEYLCDFIEMIGISDLTNQIPTIKRGHYGLLDPSIKLKILKELVDRVLSTDLVREKLDEYLEQRQALAASKREEAVEEGKKKREAKEHLKVVSEANGMLPEHNSDIIEDGPGVIRNNDHSMENGNCIEKMSADQSQSLRSRSVFSASIMTK